MSTTRKRQPAGASDGKGGQYAPDTRGKTPPALVERTSAPPKTENIQDTETFDIAYTQYNGTTGKPARPTPETSTSKDVSNDVRDVPDTRRVLSDVLASIESEIKQLESSEEDWDDYASGKLFGLQESAGSLEARIEQLDAE